MRKSDADMPQQTVAVLMPRENLWYSALAEQIANGFRACGCTVFTYCGFLSEADLSAWVRQRRVSLVFDMNRPRADLPRLPADILHISWIVDFNGREINDFYGSDITYLFGPKWLEKIRQPGIYRWLGPGICPHSYFPSTQSIRYEASFVGHIPKPWTAAELARELGSTEAQVTFGDILVEWESVLIKNRALLKVHGDYLQLFQTWFLERFGGQVSLDRTLEYDISARLVRLLNRRELIDKLLAVADVALFGPTNWGEWPEYAPYYQEFLQTSDEMRRVYAGSLVTFHEGNNMHFRVLDAMASGGLVFVRKNDYDEKIGGIKTFFTPGVHYLEFDLENLKDQYRYYISNPSACAKIRQSAATAVINRHTWQHRAESVLADLKSLRYL